MKKVCLSILILLFCLPLANGLFQVPASSSDSEQIINSEPVSVSSSATWTVMIYLDADCNLESAGIEDINEMETVGSSDKLNIIALVDRTSGYDTSNGDWTGTRVYKIKRDSSGYTVGS
ncbi:MAG: hypothetical protein ACFFBD_06550 [Candidatus Hodarchaeota archaeon]